MDVNNYQIYTVANCAKRAHAPPRSKPDRRKLQRMYRLRPEIVYFRWMCAVPVASQMGLPAVMGNQRLLQNAFAEDVVLRREHQRTHSRAAFQKA